MIEVVAPSSLPEGYQFEAQLPHNNKKFTVIVPKGGVQSGQKFMVPLPTTQSLSDYGIIPKMIIPVGHWRDGMIDIFKHGVCHYSVLNSIFCIPIAAAQVITRLKLTWNGQANATPAQSSSAFWIILAVVVVYWVVKWTLRVIYWNSFAQEVAASTSSFPQKPTHDQTGGMIAAIMAIRIWWFLYTGFTIYLLRNVRKYIRSKYAIPENEQCPTGCEDFLCSCVCPCLTAAQMMRHTTDYDTYRSSFCSETGLPAHVPAIL